VLTYAYFSADELDVGKLSTELTAKYGSINAAQLELGDAHAIRKTFVEFQQHLYAA
jgi:type I restriction enzyme R subunit